MKVKILKKLTALCIAVLMLLMVSAPAFAAESTGEGVQTEALSESDSAESAGSEVPSKAWAAAVCVGLVAAVGAAGMAATVSKTADSIARQPEAAEEVRGSMMLGLVFIETAIIYALIVGILIIFVL